MKCEFKDLQKFRGLLEEKGLTQTELAKLAGVTQSYMNQVCNGKRIPSESLSKKISAVLQIEFDDIFKKDYNIKPFEISDSFHEFPFDFMPMIAKSVGVNESIVINFLTMWQHNYKVINWNNVEGEHFISIEPDQWEEIFSFWDKETINSTLNSLLSKELVIVQDRLYRVNIRKLEVYSND